MSLYRRFVIAGLGLIGGSLGMAVKRHGLAEEVVGLARRRETIDQALDMGAVDAGTLDPMEAAADADAVVLAAPVMASMALGRVMMPHMKPGSVVTDVCSTKSLLIAELKKAKPEGLSLIGGHPMAGAEKAGIAYASADLFVNARYLLMPVEDRDGHGERLAALVREIGARPEVVELEEHDALVAMVSHLPHAAAQCLVNTVADLGLKELTRLAAGGFKDITRVAGSDPRMWSDIYISNKTEVLRALELFKSQLDRLSDMISGSDEEALLEFLKNAKEYRDGLSG